MLYFESPTNTFTQWVGQRIGDIAYPRNIEQFWSASELAAIGLYAPEPADPVPAGKVVTVTDVQRINGVVKYVNTLADAPPPAVPLSITSAQARVTLAKHSLLDAVNSAVNASDQPTQLWWEYSTTIDRNSTVLAAVAKAPPLNMTDAQLDALFIEAATYSA